MLQAALLSLLGAALPEERTARQALLDRVKPQDAPVVAPLLVRASAGAARLTETVGMLVDAAGQDRERLLPLVRAALAELVRDARTSCVQARLATGALDADELAGWLAQQVEAGRLHAEALMQVVSWAEEPGRPLPLLERLEGSLAGHADERVRRIALAALRGAAGVRGWDPARASRLRKYLEDSSPLVAGAAWSADPGGMG